MNVTLTESGYTLDGKWRLVPVEPTYEMAILSLDGGLDYKLGVKAAPPPPAQSPWQPIATAPDDRPCIVGWVDLTNTDRYYFDIKQDGVWQDHDASCEMAEACAPAGTVLPNRIPPYAYFIEIPPLPEPAP